MRRHGAHARRGRAGQGAGDALRDGDEQAFARIIDESGPPGCFAWPGATWSATPRPKTSSRRQAPGDAPRARGSSRADRLRTWVLRRVVNIAKSVGARARRPPVSSSPRPSGRRQPRALHVAQGTGSRAPGEAPPSWPAMPEGEVVTPEAYEVVGARWQPRPLPAGRHDAAGPRRLRRLGGVRSAGAHAGQPAGAAPPRPSLCTPRVESVLRGTHRAPSRRGPTVTTRR